MGLFSKFFKNLVALLARVPNESESSMPRSDSSYSARLKTI